MDRGTESVNSLLDYLIFNIVPTLVDVIIAITYFTTAFSAWFGLIIFLMMVIFLAITITGTAILIQNFLEKRRPHNIKFIVLY